MDWAQERLKDTKPTPSMDVFFQYLSTFYVDFLMMTVNGVWRANEPSVLQDLLEAETLDKDAEIPREWPAAQWSDMYS